MKAKLTTITNNKTVKTVTGAAIIFGGFLLLKRLFRGEDEIIGEAEWADDDDDADETAEDGE